jgi:hypothetical protein
MKHLIDKDALVAEIKRTEKISKDEAKKAVDTYFKIYFDGWVTACRSILSFLDTLEVKEVDLEKDVRQIFSLYYEGLKHYEDIIKEEREENGGSDLAIKIMDGVVDARELGIQYVIDKLKAQK